MGKLKYLIWSIFRKFGLGPLLLRMHPKSALVQLGWFKSFRGHIPIDNKMEPVPWWAYSAIHFIEERLSDSFRVLEFGCGNSTVWLSERVKDVISIEFDSVWAERIASIVPKNTKIIVTKSSRKFLAEDHDKLGKFQVLIIDAGNRLEIATNASTFISDDGVVLYDDSNSQDWLDLRNLMAQNGFKEISFLGMGPQDIVLCRTTIFYRQHNCLGI